MDCMLAQSTLGLDLGDAFIVELKDIFRYKITFVQIDIRYVYSLDIVNLFSRNCELNYATQRLSTSVYL